MSATRCSLTLLSQHKKTAPIAIGAVALLVMMGPALSAEAASKDEVLTLTAAIQVPSIPALTNFDISYFNPVMKEYLLAARDAKAVAIVDTTNNSIKLSDKVFGGNTGSNTTAGPNGVWTVNGTEIWAADGLQQRERQHDKGARRNGSTDQDQDRYDSRTTNISRNPNRASR